MPITLISNEDTNELSSGPTTIVREESVTPETFIDLAEKDPGSIKSVRIKFFGGSHLDNRATLIADHVSLLLIEFTTSPGRSLRSSR